MDVEAVRKDFEEWFEDDPKYKKKALERSLHGNYSLMVTDSAWRVWLACAEKYLTLKGEKKS